MRCLYSRFEQYPHRVTKVLQTLLRYLDSGKGQETRNRRKYLVFMGLILVAPASRRLSCGRPARSISAASTAAGQGEGKSSPPGYPLRGQDALATAGGTPALQEPNTPTALSLPGTGRRFGEEWRSPDRDGRP